jgi:ABC-type lipoprotein export system ATPase subunit
MTDLPEIVDLPGAEERARRPRERFGDQTLIVCDNLVKIYKVADLEVVALQGLDLLIERGEFVAMVGASGSGKSTLLNVLGGLDVPSAGRAVVAGHQLTELTSSEQTLYLRRVIGFVWQQTARNVLPYLSALENVMLPMVFDGVATHDRERRARELLAQVGLADRADHRPDRLSGGEQQRVAIAVALANQPEVLLADEPTGELDTTTAGEIFELLRRLNRELGLTIVVATHDPLVSTQVSRTVAIRDGRVSSETLRQRTVSAAGDHLVESTEFAVLDRVGRLQLPRAHVEALGLERRVRLDLETDHIAVWPDRPVVPAPLSGPAASIPLTESAMAPAAVPGLEVTRSTPPAAELEASATPEPAVEPAPPTTAEPAATADPASPTGPTAPHSDPGSPADPTDQPGPPPPPAAPPPARPAADAIGPVPQPPYRPQGRNR